MTWGEINYLVQVLKFTISPSPLFSFSNFHLF